MYTCIFSDGLQPEKVGWIYSVCAGILDWDEKITFDLSFYEPKRIIISSLIQKRLAVVGIPSFSGVIRAKSNSSKSRSSKEVDATASPRQFASVGLTPSMLSCKNTIYLISLHKYTMWTNVVLTTKLNVSSFLVSLALCRFF
jgi:hypothetical protein